MHELSIASSILELIGTKVPDKTKLDHVHITIGPLAGIFSDSLEFCFNVLAAFEGYSKASLVIHRVPARFLCMQCQFVYESERIDITCPRCESFERNILSGSECTIDSIEVEE